MMNEVQMGETFSSRFAHNKVFRRKERRRKIKAREVYSAGLVLVPMFVVTGIV
jgi:hypothetical protein